MSTNKKNKKEKTLTKSNKEFLSITSHQLRTPLSTILSSVDLLELYIKKKNITRQLQVLNKIKNSILYLRNVIDNITELYKNETLKPTIKKIDLRKFVNDLIEEIIIEAREDHLINVHIDDSLKEFRGDEFILKQILVNLFLNSIKFSPEGGQILLSVKKSGSYLNFSVRDEGIGIDEKEIKNLFKPFYRAKNVENIPGLGLGLAIVHKLVKLHKGKIKITSSLNKGTEVNVLIPLEL